MHSIRKAVFLTGKRTEQSRHFARRIGILLGLAAALFLPFCSPAKDGVLASNKLRLIVLTDINPYNLEPDDAESLIRLLLYSNQIDIEAIMPTPSWVNHTMDESSYQRILTAVHAYGQVRSNLAVHASGYPTEDYLTNRVKHGTLNWSMANVGAGKSNEGSDFIISVVDNTNDSRHVWVAAWTGLTTLAQALYDVRATRSHAAVDAFCSKLTVYDIDSQDDCSAWIMHNFPRIKYLCSDWQFWGFSTRSDGTGRVVGDPVAFNDVFVYVNILWRGPLGAAYPHRVYDYETDSPSFMYTILNGLNDPDEQSWGGWGGRFSEYPVLNPPSQNYAAQDNQSYWPYYGYRDEPDTFTYAGFTYTNSLFAPIARWKTAYQNEMAARMEWSTNSTYAGCNHAPMAILNGDATLNLLVTNALPGQSITLSAAGSSDPDGDSLSYNWYVYSDPGTYKNSISISNAQTSQATVLIPGDATNDTIHVVLEVTDHGIHFPLTAYRRAIIRTGGGGAPVGVMTTVNDGETGTNFNQFEYVGSWGAGLLTQCHQGDDHYTWTAGDYANFRFNGTKIKLYGAINFSLGNGTVQLDGGTPSPISFYGANIEGSVLLYSSPTVPSGPHVLKVTANGDASLAIDKAIVFSVPTAPTLTWSVADGMVNLCWPEYFLGWSLQVQTNLAGDAGQWFTLPGTEAITTTNLPMAASGSAFYRLKRAN